MSWSVPGFVIAIIAISTIGWMFTSWIRAKHGYPLEGEWGGTVQQTDPDADRKAELMAQENERLHGQVGRLEERIAVLERIATDRPARLADEINNLRLQPRRAQGETEWNSCSWSRWSMSSSRSH